MPKERARRGEPLPDSATVVVRGDLLDPAAVRRDADDNFEVYGFWGVSVFAEVGGRDLAWISATKLPNPHWLVLFRAGDLITAGLDLWDTGQSPHYDVVHQDATSWSSDSLPVHTGSSPTPARHAGGLR